ncbi:hypothetical protein Plhal710r2_c016g0071001 [Plasmopara halstedii]
MFLIHSLRELPSGTFAAICCHAIEFANVVASRAFAVGQFWLAKSDPAPHIELDDTS